MDDQLKAFWALLNTDARTLWANNKIFFIVFGLLILIIKFRSVIIDLLVSDSKQLLADTQKKDQQLKSEEDKTNSQANQLVSDANKLDQNKPTVGEDWNKK